jgi:hypothetical protein
MTLDQPIGSNLRNVDVRGYVKRSLLPFSLILGTIIIGMGFFFFFATSRAEMLIGSLMVFIIMTTIAAILLIITIRGIPLKAGVYEKTIRFVRRNQEIGEISFEEIRKMVLSPTYHGSLANVLTVGGERLIVPSLKNDLDSLISDAFISWLKHENRQFIINERRSPSGKNRIILPDFDS